MMLALLEFGDFKRLGRLRCGESLTHRRRANPTIRRGYAAIGQTYSRGPLSASNHSPSAFIREDLIQQSIALGSVYYVSALDAAANQAGDRSDLWQHSS